MLVGACWGLLVMLAGCCSWLVLVGACRCCLLVVVALLLACCLLVAAVVVKSGDDCGAKMVFVCFWRNETHYVGFV